MLEEIKKCFVHGYLEDDEGETMFRANGKRIPILIKKGDKPASELAVSEEICNRPPDGEQKAEIDGNGTDVVSGEFSVSGSGATDIPSQSDLMAQTQDVTPTTPIPDVTSECNGDPLSCNQSRYGEGANGFYRYYCNRSGNPMPCDAASARSYEKHYTEVERKPGDDIIDPIDDEDILDDTDTPTQEGEPF